MRSRSATIPSTAIALEPPVRSTASLASGVEGDAGIESLRGLMILLLVAYHAVDVTGAGRAGSGYSPYYHFAFTVDSIMMPVFAAVAGFVYAMRPVRRGEEGRFMGGKIRRLLVPYFVAVTATYLLRHVSPAAHTAAPLRDLWRAYLFSYEHFWFLQALFLIFAGVCVLERGQLLERRKTWAAILAASTVIPQVVAGSAFFSLWGAIYLMPFFVLGYGVHRHATLFGHQTIIVAIALMVGGMAALQLCWWGYLKISSDRTGPLGLLVGMSSCVVLLRFRRATAPLAVLGIYSYAIYLYHAFGLAAGKRLWTITHSDSDLLCFTMRIVLGIALGIIVHLVVIQVPLLRRVVLGRR